MAVTMFVSANTNQTQLLLVVLTFTIVGFVGPSLGASIIQEVVTTLNNTELGGSSYKQLSTAQVVRMQGWNAEEHDVTSQDGYITRLVRVINPEADQTKTGRDVVVIHHGILQTTVSPIITFGYKPASRPHPPPTRYNTSERILVALPYYLANNDYDVWLLEARGSTKESSRHRNISFQQSDDYWSFSLDEQGLYDLPAQIDFILNRTSQSKLAYVGYSETTTFMYQLLSERPDFANKLVVFVAVAPVVYLEGTSGIIEFVDLWPLSNAYLNSQNAPVLGTTKAYPFLSDIFQLIQSTRVSSATFGRALLAFFVGTDQGHNVVSIEYVSSLLHPTSDKALGHFLQIKDTGTFSHYNYGREANLEHYGQEKPPVYNLTNVDFDRMVMFRSPKGDIVSTEVSNDRLIRELGAPLWRDHLMPDYYNHQSFFIGEDCFKYVTEPMRQDISDAFAAASKKG